MARTQTMVQLTDELVARLDEEANGRGLSRSALVREAIEAYLEHSTRARVDAAIVEGYSRMPPAVPDQWGDPDRAAEVGSVELSQRLDAEEQAAGFEPW